MFLFFNLSFHCFNSDKLNVTIRVLTFFPQIKNNYDLITVSDICDMLNVTRDRITNTWTKLGLKLRKKKLTNNMSYYVITWDNLMNF